MCCRGGVCCRIWNAIVSHRRHSSSVIAAAASASNTASATDISSWSSFICCWDVIICDLWSRSSLVYYHSVVFVSIPFSCYCPSFSVCLPVATAAASSFHCNVNKLLALNSGLCGWCTMECCCLHYCCHVARNRHLNRIFLFPIFSNISFSLPLPPPTLSWWPGYGLYAAAVDYLYCP